MAGPIFSNPNRKPLSGILGYQGTDSPWSDTAAQEIARERVKVESAAAGPPLGHAGSQPGGPPGAGGPRGISVPPTQPTQPSPGQVPQRVEAAPMAHQDPPGHHAGDGRGGPKWPKIMAMQDWVLAQPGGNKIVTRRFLPKEQIAQMHKGYERYVDQQMAMADFMLKRHGQDQRLDIATQRNQPTPPTPIQAMNRGAATQATSQNPNDALAARGAYAASGRPPQPDPTATQQVAQQAAMFSMEQNPGNPLGAAGMLAGATRAPAAPQTGGDQALDQLREAAIKELVSGIIDGPAIGQLAAYRSAGKKPPSRGIISTADVSKYMLGDPFIPGTGVGSGAIGAMSGATDKTAEWFKLLGGRLVTGLASMSPQQQEGIMGFVDQHRPPIQERLRFIKENGGIGAFEGIKELLFTAEERKQIESRYPGAPVGG